MRLRPLFFSLVVLSVLGCGGGSNDDEDGETDGGENLDPAREVPGCYECDETEYCIHVYTDAELYYCAPDPCDDECDCLMRDAAKRYDECSSSCQVDSDMVFCAK
ncbi:MAG: hypothetical protein HOV80_06385 [Polyangiaceae bacterium]|nr:hypothetical protein [Polyangiaceae bacterium]